MKGIRHAECLAKLRRELLATTLKAKVDTIFGIAALVAKLYTRQVFNSCLTCNTARRGSLRSIVEVRGKSATHDVLLTRIPENQAGHIVTGASGEGCHVKVAHSEGCQTECQRRRLGWIRISLRTLGVVAVRNPDDFRTLDNAIKGDFTRRGIEHIAGSPLRDVVHRHPNRLSWAE